LEIATGAALAALYYWEATSQLAPRLPDVVPAAEVMLHQQFFSHAVLLLLMLAATFIDFDEKTIPDEITIPGTLAGLVLSALWPNSHLPVERFIRPPLPVTGYGPLLFTSSDHWPAWLDGQRGLVAGLAIFVTWCIVLIPALCTLRRGWRKAVAYYFASLARDSAWWKLLLLAVLGSGLIAAVWSQGGERWQALFTSLVGLAFGGGLIWAVRIVGQVALQKEAMGFGDVTLMAMIGAFLGWQACLMIFFLSPFAALFIAVAQWAVTGRRDIAFGPYLCLAAAIVVVRWPAFWTSVEPLFAAGWLVPGVLAVCLLLMLGLLMLWRVLEQAMFSRADRAADRRRG
jgi:prepilin signal peptidase PulO-like enzyme (type II secretory pathway)